MQEIQFCELSFLPPISFFILLAKESVTIEKHENYQKRSFRNKCIIATSEGPLTLTVPLRKGKHQSQPVTEVTIAYDEPWQNIHLSSISTAYHNAPFFEYYFNKLESIYRNAGDHLFLFNNKLLGEICDLLQLDFPPFTGKYLKDPGGIDWRGIVTPRNYHKIRVPKYNQVFEDRHEYLNNLSIIDLLFCLGPETTRYLKSAKMEFEFEIPGM